MAIVRRILLTPTRCKPTKLKLPTRSLASRPIAKPNIGAQTSDTYSGRPQVRGISSQPRPYVHPSLSYAFGRSNDHLVYTTIAQQLETQAKTSPDHQAFASYLDDKLVTFGGFNDEVNRLAKALVQKLNIVKGDVIGVFAYNCYNWLLAQYACLRVGAILTPINPSYKAAELTYLLKEAKVKCLFLPGDNSMQMTYNQHLNLLQSDEVCELTRANALHLRNVILMDNENHYNPREVKFKLSNCQLHLWDDLQTDGRVFSSPAEAEQAGLNPENDDVCIIDPNLSSPDDLFAIYFTSGTTGKPKGACVSQFTALNAARLCQLRLRAGRPKNWSVRSVTVLPMFHIFAGVLTALSPLVANNMVALSGFKYDIGDLVRAIIKYEGNVITLTPTMLIDLLAYIERKKITNFPLRSIQSGGAHLPPEMFTRTFKILPELEELRTGYGSTENGGVATMQTLHEPRDTKAISVGSPIDFTELRVVRPNTDEIVAHGERGEIETRGFNTMTKYLGQPDKTAEVLTNKRWYKTGDVGLMHPHGSIQVCARLKHLIIKGGENIYPEEVQQLIYQLPYVEDAHVIGVPDERYGEQVCAWIKLKSGYSEARELADRSEHKIHKDDVIDFCKTNITYFKVPKYLLFVDEFPMTPTKKVQNHLMIEMSVKLLGLEDQQKSQRP